MGWRKLAHGTPTIYNKAGIRSRSRDVGRASDSIARVGDFDRKSLCCVHDVTIWLPLELDSGRFGVQNETGSGCDQPRPILDGKEVPYGFNNLRYYRFDRDSSHDHGNERCRRRSK